MQNTMAQPWWKDIVCYQVWPASYKDSNGDGLGDIKGLLSTLDYLKDLGVDVIWLSPMYDSPQKDMGYDISDYESVYPPYGTMSDMEELIRELKQRGMRLILDLVINHTSSEHAWFKESRVSRDNPKSDWYIWRAPRYVDGERQPPNNWRASFGGSAWEYVPERDQYYLHLFEIEQPDLNWESEPMRRAMYRSAIEFWLERGVDGFRVDTVNLYSKPLDFPDAAVSDDRSPWQSSGHLYMNGPRIHEFVKEMRALALDRFGDVVMVGELANTSYEEGLRYTSAASRELDMVFDFDMVLLGGNQTLPKHLVTAHTLTDFKASVMKCQQLVSATDSWPTVFAENHDQPRSIPRFTTTNPQYWRQAGKVLAALLSTLSGTLFLYQGQEIGMTNVPVSWVEEDFRDVDTVKYLAEMQERYPGDDEMRKQALRGVQQYSRDNARTPVQWDGSTNAGFTSSESTWIPVNSNYKSINVAAQRPDEDSILNFWKRMLALRKEHKDLFVYGTFECLDYDDGDVFTYTKSAANGDVALVELNFSNRERPVSQALQAASGRRSCTLLASNVGVAGEQLQPWEARVSRYTCI